MKPQQHKRMPSTLQGEEDLFYLLFLTCCCNKLLDVLYGSSVALIIAPLCVWLLVAARCPWPHYAHILHQKDYAHPFRKQFTWRRNVSAFFLLVLRTTVILNLVQILVFGWHMTINTMILNTLIFALGCGVRLSRPRGGDIVSGTCSTTTGRHGAQPQLDEETSLGVDSGCSCSSQDLEQHVGRTADVHWPDLRDSAPACAAASSSPPCKNNASESAVDTAANPRRSMNDHEEPALPKGGEIIPPSPAKTAHAWVIDTGSAFHVTQDRELLPDLHPSSVLSEELRMPSELDKVRDVPGLQMQGLPTRRARPADADHMPMDIDASSSTQAGGDPVVLLDSGACFHITGLDGVLQNREALEGQSVVGISGKPLPVTEQGSIMGTPIWLDKVGYVEVLPKLSKLIVSVSQLTRARSARVVFEPDFCRVERMSDNCTIGQGKMVGDLYTLDCLTQG